MKCEICNGARKNQHKETLIVDIDGVLMHDTQRWDDYDKRFFLPESIKYFRKLAEYYRLVAYTSRKSEEGFWSTIEDFQRMKLDEIFECIYFDKPVGKFIIDDKAINFESIEDVKFLEDRLK